MLCNCGHHHHLKQLSKVLPLFKVSVNDRKGLEGRPKNRDQEREIVHLHYQPAYVGSLADKGHQHDTLEVNTNFFLNNVGLIVQNACNSMATISCRTNPVKYRTNPVTCRTNPVKRHTNPVMSSSGPCPPLSHHSLLYPTLRPCPQPKNQLL